MLNRYAWNFQTNISKYAPSKRFKYNIFFFVRKNMTDLIDDL